MAHDPLDIAGQERDAQAAELARKVARDQAVADFKWLLSDRRGRRFIWSLLGFTGVFRSSFTGNNTTFFNEGQRNVGLQILADINEHAPDAYARMLEEQRNA